MKSWIDTPRVYSLEKQEKLSDVYEKKISLTENHESHTTSKLKTQLLEHQQKTLKAMMDLEKRRFVEVKLDSVDAHKFIKPVLETNAGIVSEKPGSGKTYEIFALLAESSKNQNIAEITSIPLPKIKEVNTQQYKNRSNYHNIGFTYEVRRTYKHIYRQFLIFVGKSVLAQWMTRFKKYTDFKVLVIGDIYDLREFYRLIKEDKKKLDKYDVFLVKNGIVAGSFDVPELKGSPLYKSKSKPLLNIFGILFTDDCFERVIIDDFDILPISTNAQVIPAKFTWFISATKRNPPSKRVPTVYYNTEDILRSYRPTYANIWNNRELFTFFNIGCDNKFIDKSTNASLIEYYVYKFKNPNDQFIGMISYMGDSGLSIAEMLNGDAFNEAADTLGVKSEIKPNSVSEIFERILDKNWEVYKKNLEIERYLPKAKSIISKLPILTDLEYSASQTSLDDLAKNLRKPGPSNNIRNIIKFQQTSVADLIAEVESGNRYDKENNGKAIQRVKDNLKEGECPITCEPLSSCKGIVVMRCCGTAISREGSELIFKKYTNCPNCRAPVKSNNIILIDRDLDKELSGTINKILEEDILNESEEEDSSEMIDNLEVEIELEEEESEEDQQMNKYNCIVKIIQGEEETIEAREVRDDILIPNLLEGSNDCGFAKPEERKVLIYANYNETMECLEKKLIRKGIAYAKLFGTARQISEIVKRYYLSNNHPEAINVLLIKGPKYCAGLDLQNTTDLIFCFKVIDRNIETQVAGRVARYGRTRNARIHYVLYENEYTFMFANRKTK